MCNGKALYISEIARWEESGWLVGGGGLVQYAFRGSIARRLISRGCYCYCCCWETPPGLGEKGKGEGGLGMQDPEG